MEKYTWENFPQLAPTPLNSVQHQLKQEEACIQKIPEEDLKGVLVPCPFGPLSIFLWLRSALPFPAEVNGALCTAAGILTSVSELL